MRPIEILGNYLQQLRDKIQAIEQTHKQGETEVPDPKVLQSAGVHSNK